MKTQLQPSSIKTQIVEDKSLLNERCDAFQISDSIERHVDSSYDEKDIRLNFFVDNQWVLKVNSKNELNESRVDEKEENIQMLNSCLIEEKEIALAENLDNTNRICRQRIA